MNHSKFLDSIWKIFFTTHLMIDSYTLTVQMYLFFYHNSHFFSILWTYFSISGKQYPDLIINLLEIFIYQNSQFPFIQSLNFLKTVPKYSL